MTKAYKTAYKMQENLLKHFEYWSDEKKYGVGEKFEHEVRKLIKGIVFVGDCDTAARTMIERAVKLKLVKKRNLIELVTPNHYIAGVIDHEINDVWVIENTAWKFTRKAVEAGAGMFINIVNMPTYLKYANGYIEPAVYKLSDLQKGVIEDDVATKEFIIRGREKKYYMESFKTRDNKIIDWEQSRSDLPFLKDFVEIRDIDAPSAEYAKSRYKFTKEWESGYRLEKNDNIDWDKYPNFTESEFTCNCGQCGKPKINEEIVKVLQNMRDIYGRPIRVNSAYRCLVYNRSIDSEDTSSHIKGCAVDILTPTIHDRFVLEGIARDCGIVRIGTYKNMFIHIDTDKDKRQEVHWLG